MPNKTQTKSTNPSKPPSRTNSIIKPSSKKKVEGEAINKSLPSNRLSGTNSLKRKPSKLKPTVQNKLVNSIKVNSCIASTHVNCLLEFQRYESQVEEIRESV